MTKAKIFLALLALSCAASAWAQEPARFTFKPYTITEQDAAAINLRRPSSWSPFHVSAGDVFELYPFAPPVIIIPTTERRSDGQEVIFEDLEPVTCGGKPSC